MTLFMSLTVVSVALAIGAVWEIGEYTVDDIFHTNNQQNMKSTRSTLYDKDDVPLVGHEALADTMKDLMLDLGGAVVVATIEYKTEESKRKRHSLNNCVFIISRHWSWRSWPWSRWEWWPWSWSRWKRWPWRKWWK